MILDLLQKKCKIECLVPMILAYCRHPVADLFVRSHFGKAMKLWGSPRYPPHLYGVCITQSYLRPARPTSRSHTTVRDHHAREYDVIDMKAACMCRCNSCCDKRHTAWSHRQAWERKVATRKTRRENTMAKYARDMKAYNTALAQWQIAMDGEFALHLESDSTDSWGRVQARLIDATPEIFKKPRKPRAPGVWVPTPAYQPQLSIPHTMVYERRTIRYHRYTVGYGHETEGVVQPFPYEMSWLHDTDVVLPSLFQRHHRQFWSNHFSNATPGSQQYELRTRRNLRWG